MFTDEQKLNMLIEAVTNKPAYFYKDCDDDAFLKLIRKIKCQTYQLQEIKEITHKALEPICYKSYCEFCSCYHFKGEKLSDILNQYFTQDGEFIDESGTFMEDLEGLIERERKACNKALPVAQKILQILERNI